jgi:hypothetical protein
MFARYFDFNLLGEFWSIYVLLFNALFCVLTFYFQLDIVFHFNKVYAVLDEFIMAGEVQETSKKVILERMAQLEKLE